MRTVLDVHVNCVHYCNRTPVLQPASFPAFRCSYVFSSDVARALVETHAIAPLKFMPNEDATFGFWVMVRIA